MISIGCVYPGMGFERIQKTHECSSFRDALNHRYGFEIKVHALCVEGR